MSDFLGRLAARSLGLAPLAQPVVPAMFAPPRAVESYASDQLAETTRQVMDPPHEPRRINVSPAQDPVFESHKDPPLAVENQIPLKAASVRAFSVIPVPVVREMAPRAVQQSPARLGAELTQPSFSNEVHQSIEPLRVSPEEKPIVAERPFNSRIAFANGL